MVVLHVGKDLYNNIDWFSSVGSDVLVGPRCWQLAGSGAGGVVVAKGLLSAGTFTRSQQIMMAKRLFSAGTFPGTQENMMAKGLLKRRNQQTGTSKSQQIMMAEGLLSAGTSKAESRFL